MYFRIRVRQLVTECFRGETGIYDGVSPILSVLLLSFAIYVAVAKPSVPAKRVTTDLDYYLEKVEDGYGSYSKKFYRLIDKQGKKLSVETGVTYRSDMYNTLDDHFDETVVRLEAEEVRFFDDAKAWASRFPEAEERTDRKEIAENALKKGLGTAVGETLEEVKEGAKNFFRRAADFIKDALKGEN